MLEPPNLPNETILARLRAAYPLEAEEITFLPLGNDADGWVFRADQRYFLKLKRGVVYMPGLEVPYWLHQQGIREVVAPIPALDGRLFADLDGYTLIVYPFIDGADGMTRGMNQDEWREFGRLLRNIHAAVPPPGMAPREEFHPPFAPVVHEIDALIARNHFDDPIEQALADEWRSRRADFLAILTRAEALGSQLRAAPPEFVLCHSDIHTANLMIDTNGGLHIIDWDNPQLAPRERDLMFIPGGQEGDWFFQGYASGMVIDYTQNTSLIAAAYYHCEWVVQEIGDYGRRVFQMPELGAASKELALLEFQRLFAPGDVVDSARQMLNKLPAGLPG